MFRFPLPIVSLFACLAITACSEEGVIRKPDSDGTGGQALAEFRNSLEQPRNEVIPEGPQIDPGAQNIDPFKYGLKYNYQERQILEGLITEARQDPDYLARSLTATEAGLTELVPAKKWDDYVTFLECAVQFDLGARSGLMSAYKAQDLAAKFVTASLDPEIGTLTAEELEQIRADRQAMLDAEGPRERYAREEEEKEQLAKLRTRNYLNYFLIRDRDEGVYSPEELQARIDTCMTFDKAVNLELETEE